MDLTQQRDALISNLMDEKYLRTARIIKAFREVPREEFVPEGDRQFAYSDYPLEIACGQTISAPHMVAIMTELLKPKTSDRVLEIGAGSGYQAGILSKLVERVYTVEVEGELSIFARSNLDRIGARNVDIIVGDGSRGHPKSAPYDKIIVTCATPEIFQAWKDQLKDGGILLAPVGGYYHQELILVKRNGAAFPEEKHGGCIFVPLRQR